jgi:hypothetical protein
LQLSGSFVETKTEEAPLKHRVLLSAAICLLALSASAATSAPIRDGNLGPPSYEMQLGGVGTITNLRHVMVPGAEFEASETRNSSTGVIKRYAGMKFGQVELELTPANMWMFASMLNGNSSGVSGGAVVPIQVHTINGNPTRGTWTDLGNCLLSRAEFPELDYSNLSGLPTYIQLKLQPEYSTVMDAPKPLPAGPAVPASLAQPTAPLTMTAQSFAVTMPGVDMSGVVKVGSIVIQAKLAMDAVGGNLRSPTFTTADVSNEPVTLIVRGATAWALQAWQEANVATAPTKRELTIQFMNKTNSTTLFTMRGVDVGLLTMHPLRVNDSNPQSFEAKLFVGHWVLSGPSAKPDKFEGVVPLTAPIMTGTRK